MAIIFNLYGPDRKFVKDDILFLFNFMFVIQAQLLKLQ